MKKSLVLLAGVSMAFIGLPAVSHAQAASGPFADVPTDHWAYQSVDTLQKAGIVIGYPDGTYGGRRPMTRYEFAVAIARLLAQMKNPSVSAADLANLRSDLENRISGQTPPRLTPCAHSGQRLSAPELTRLGQDVAAGRCPPRRLWKPASTALEHPAWTNLTEGGQIGVLADRAALASTLPATVNIIAEGRCARGATVGVSIRHSCRSSTETAVIQGATGFENRLLGSYGCL